MAQFLDHSLQSDKVETPVKAQASGNDVAVSNQVGGKQFEAIKGNWASTAADVLPRVRGLDARGGDDKTPEPPKTSDAVNTITKVMDQPRLGDKEKATVVGNFLNKMLQDNGRSSTEELIKEMNKDPQLAKLGVQIEQTQSNIKSPQALGVDLKIGGHTYHIDMLGKDRNFQPMVKEVKGAVGRSPGEMPDIKDAPKANRESSDRDEQKPFSDLPAKQQLDKLMQAVKNQDFTKVGECVKSLKNSPDKLDALARAAQQAGVYLETDVDQNGKVRGLNQFDHPPQYGGPRKLLHSWDLEGHHNAPKS